MLFAKCCAYWELGQIFPNFLSSQSFSDFHVAKHNGHFSAFISLDLFLHIMQLADHSLLLKIFFPLFLGHHSLGSPIFLIILNEITSSTVTFHSFKLLHIMKYNLTYCIYSISVICQSLQILKCKLPKINLSLLTTVSLPPRAVPAI